MTADGAPPAASPTLADEILRRHAGKPGAESRALVGVLSAVLDAVTVRGLAPSPAALFAALMAALDGPRALDEPQVRKAKQVCGEKQGRATGGAAACVSRSPSRRVWAAAADSSPHSRPFSLHRPYPPWPTSWTWSWSGCPPPCCVLGSRRLPAS